LNFREFSAVFKSEGFYFAESSGKCDIDIENKGAERNGIIILSSHFEEMKAI